LKLSQLELVGFKSFCEPTKFSFSKGLTGIVGPNGCGKSNISDAIHWVLGEQNARRLRGGTMKDVIFKGTSKRTAHSYTEVSITIENDKKILPIEYEEVKIARKLYADGSSDYYINNQQCRLKDILNLFYDTGMGRRAYSFIEQKMIEDLLNSTDEDKRYLFEEAAGIMKYNQSQRTCENKLKNVENDLIRLDDIISEVKYQVGSLRHQVGKAKRYQNLNNKITTIKIQLAGIKFFEMHAKLKPMNEKFLSLEKQITENNHQLTRLNADFSKKEQELLKKEDELKEELRQQRAIEDAISAHETKILLNKQQIENSNNKLQETYERIKAIEKQKLSGSDALEQEHEKLKETEALLGEQIEQTKKLEAKLKETQAKVQALNKKNDEIYHEINELQSKKQRILNEKNEFETRKKLISEQIERIKNKVADYQIKFESFSKLVKDHQAKQEENEHVLKNLQKKKEDSEYSLEKTTDDEQNLQDQINNLQITIRSLENEIAQLEEWERNFAGYSDATKKILDNFKDKNFTTLAENISVQKEYVNLIEQALRNMLLSAICPENYIQEVLSFLHDESLNGQIIINQSNINTTHKPMQIENTIPLQEVISFPNSVIHPRLFVNYYITEDISVALDLAKKYRDIENDIYFLSKNGEIISNKGIVTTHSVKQTSHGLLSRKEQLKKLQEKLEYHNKEKVTLFELKEKKILEKKSILEKLQITKKDISLISDMLEKGRNQLVNISVQRDNFHELMEENKESVANLEKQLEEIVRGLKSVEEKLAEVPEDDEIALQNELEKIQDDLHTARKEQYRHESLFNDQRIEQIKLEKDIAYIKQNIIRHKQAARASEEEHVRLQNSIDPLKKQIESLKKETEEHDVEFKKKVDELKSFKEKNVDIDNSYHSLRKEIESLKIQLHDLEFKKDALTKDRNEIELKIQETKLKLDHLKEDVVNHFHHDLSHDEPEEYMNLNPAELHADLEKHEKRLEGLGPINLAAINDYETQKKRLDFLNEQRKDLIDSKTNLQEAITQLNETAEKMFMKTFTIIQKNFEMLYKEIFDGGKGLLKLEDPSDPLNSKIEIYSNPKGKKITNISLLSSGEKALTAIALLFSIYLVKPSPFCILDEIDAPLDDANISRFLKLLNKFSADTQFLIITHNKRTIEAVDYLYGITMEEEGISKIVSVKLD